MSSFKDKVMSFLKEKNLESEFISYLADQDDRGNSLPEDVIFVNNHPKKDTARYMGQKHSLKRLLNTVGKKTFVQYYGIFNTERYLIHITKDGTVSAGSAKAKRSSANKIFELGMQEEALNAIANSSRVEPWVSKGAKKLLKENF